MARNELNTLERVTRQQYCDVLCLRLGEIITRELPTGAGRSEAFWKRLGPTDLALVRTCTAYEEGRTDRADLDGVAVRHLNAFRDTCRSWDEGEIRELGYQESLDPVDLPLWAGAER
jgi:hypothetical protein